MKYLVTGGAGFIGSNFIHYELDKYSHAEIINLDKLTYAGNLANLVKYKSDPRYKFVQGDVCDARLVSELVEDVDVVVHFAAESHVDRSIHNPDVFVRTNVLGTQSILDACIKHDKRLHHISTDEVFGSIPLESSEKFNEHTPYDPSSPYSASKAASDHLVRSYIRTFNLKATISNCTNNFGPYHFPEKLIPLAITNILEGKKVPVYGAGNQVRDWLYVGDHCAAIDLILHKGNLGETYCIGGMTHEITNLEVVRRLIKLMDADESVIEFVSDRPGHDVKYALDWSKINQELGWKPEADFESHLSRTVDWYKANEAWWKAVKSGEYKNYYAKQYFRKDLNGKHDRF